MSLSLKNQTLALERKIAKWSPNVHYLNGNVGQNNMYKSCIIVLKKTQISVISFE